MEELNRMIEAWEKHRDAANEFAQNAIMNGASKKEQSAHDTYIKTFNLFVNDLYELRKRMSK